MYYKSDVDTSELVFVDTDSELKVGNVFRPEGKSWT
jgi:hypothetical protein